MFQAEALETRFFFYRIKISLNHFVSIFELLYVFLDMSACYLILFVLCPVFRQADMSEKQNYLMIFFVIEKNSGPKGLWFP